MSIFKDLQPSSIYNYFEEILQVPRPSKKEEKIQAYLINFAKKNNLPYKKDEVGNILITKPATSGKENVKTVILQSHADMVPEKNSDVEHNFETDPIQAFIDNGWIRAKGTTLGADCGIGVAATLAVLTDTQIKHGKIEALFTADEETGLTGAFGIQEGFLEGEILLNLDSEDEGELFIGSAGGIDTVVNLNYKTHPIANNSVAYTISIDGLNGGHSGDEIHNGNANAIKLMTRFLWNLSKDVKFQLANFKAGRLRNAIPRDAKATICLQPNDVEKLKELYENYLTIFKNEFKVVEKNIIFELEKAELPEQVIDCETKINLINSLYACPHGVYAWSKEIEGLVETSTNLATVKFTENNTIEIVTSQRSSVESAKIDLASMVESTFLMVGANIVHSDGYPGWQPNTNSEILKITESSYKKLFNQQPAVKAIHAGLECGLFLEKYPDLDMISFGPTIKGAHTPVEGLEIATVPKFWDLLVDVLEKIK